jgi:hypothetical protein
MSNSQVVNQTKFSELEKSGASNSKSRFKAWN